MSRKKRTPSSLRSLRKQCAEISSDVFEQVFLVSSPHMISTLATAILCRAIAKLEGTFHVSFEQPIIGLETLNELRARHESSSVFVIGIDTVGKKKLRKGISCKNYD